MPSTIDVLDAAGAPQTIMTNDAVIDQLKVRDTAIALCESGSLGITTAAAWDKRIAWTVPTGYDFILSSAAAAITTAGTRTFIGAGKKLGTFNVGTNTFTDGSSVAAPRHYDRLFAVVTTAIAVATTAVAITYNDDQGASKSAGSLAITAALGAVDNLFEVTRDATAGPGFRDITAVSDATAATGIIELWGFTTILESLGLANEFDPATFPGRVAIPSGESIWIAFNAAATTAQLRLAQVLGSLVAVP